MKQSFVRMMNCISEMENCLLKGLVLDEHGNWVPIAERKAVEADSLAHLSAGQVLFEGRWVNFPEVKASRSRRVEIPPLLSRTFLPKKTAPLEKNAAPAPAVQPPPAAAGAPPGITIIVQSPPAIVSAAAPPDTAVIVQSPPEKKPRSVPQPPPPSEKKETTASAPDGPPETAVIIEEPPPSSEKETRSEEFAPETKIILIKPPEHSVSPSLSDTQILVKEPETRLFHMPNITRSEEEKPVPKNRTALIIGMIVVVATIAAVIWIVVQMVR